MTNPTKESSPRRFKEVMGPPGTLGHYLLARDPWDDEARREAKQDLMARAAPATMSERLLIHIIAGPTVYDALIASLSDLAKMSCCTVRTVSRAVRALEKRGVLHITRRTDPEDGGDLANMYQLIEQES